MGKMKLGGPNKSWETFIQINSFGNMHHKGGGFHICPGLFENWYVVVLKVSNLKLEF
jgi:hypothetical protein